MTPSNLHSVDRLAALQRTGLLDSEPEPAFDRIASLVRRLLGTETALVSMVTTDRQFFKSAVGLPAAIEGTRETPLSHSFCQHVVASETQLVVADARLNPLVADNLAVRDLGVISYLGIPIHAPGGEVVGSLCALGRETREWSGDDIDTMQDLTKLVEGEIALREHARRAGELADKNALLAREYQHRVKNALAVAAALVKLSSREAETVAVFARSVVSRLSALSTAQDLLDIQADQVDLEELVERLLSPYRSADPGSEAMAQGPRVTLRAGQVTPLCLIVHELATNSAKYGAFLNGDAVAVSWSRQDDGGVVLIWSEVSPEAAGPAGSGFGTTLLATSARQLGGTFAMSRDGARLKASLSFPMAPAASA